MKTRIIFLIAALITLPLLTAHAITSNSSYEMPNDWFKAGNAPSQYDMGIDKGAGPNGNNAATIKSIDKKINGFGTLMQMSDAGKYHGKRVRMSGYLKAKNVASWASFWFRVDGPSTNKTGKSLSFDNMENRSIKGTTAWTKYEIVLDVPDSATNLAYGALIAGTGQIWFTDISFEIVSNSVPTTDMLNTKNEPSNLDFSK